MGVIKNGEKYDRQIVNQSRKSDYDEKKLYTIYINKHI